MTSISFQSSPVGVDPEHRVHLPDHPELFPELCCVLRPVRQLQAGPGGRLLVGLGIELVRAEGGIDSKVSQVSYFECYSAFFVVFPLLLSRQVQYVFFCFVLFCFVGKSSQIPTNDKIAN